MPLTPSQTQAINATGSVAVIAGAGSGKTRVLIERYRRLLVEEKIPAHRILAFTFTEKAASEMGERILKEGLLNIEEESLAPIGTIHAFCSHLLRQHGLILGLDPSFHICSQTEALVELDTEIKKFILSHLNQNEPLIANACTQFGMKALMQMMKTIINEPHLLFKDSFFANHKPMDDPQINPLMTLTTTFHENWLKSKMTRGSLHFYDLEILAIRLLFHHPDVREKICERYQHILVDEFQDINPLQGLLIDFIHHPQKNSLFIVGDPKQSIYRFRQADVSCFLKKSKDIQNKGGSLIWLRETFRLSPPLVQTVNKIFEPLFQAGELKEFYQPMLAEDSLKKGQCFLIKAPREKMPLNELRKQEAAWIAETISQFKSDEHALVDTVLLFRTGTSMWIYRDALRQKGIPCQMHHADLLFEESDLRDLMHILGYLAGEHHFITLCGILRSPLFGFSEFFIERFIRSNPPHFLAPYTTDLFEARSDHEKWQKLTPLFKLWERKKRYLLPSVLFREIYQDLGLSLDTSVSESQPRLNLERWLFLLEELEFAGFTALPSIYEMLRTVRDEQERLHTLDSQPATPAVQLMTIHAAKGLEFGRVFLPQLYAPSGAKDSPVLLFDPQLGIAEKTEKSGPTRGLKIQLEESPLFKALKEKNEKDETEEEKRLLYVAMTRAKNELYLFLKEPWKKKKSILEADNSNDWLWCLLEEELEAALPLFETLGPGSGWKNLANKIEQALDEDKIIEEQPSTIDTPIGAQSLVSAGSGVINHVSSSFKPTFSVSQIETLWRCEKEYELKYRWGIEAVRGNGELGSRDEGRGTTHRPLTSLSATTRGTLLHEIFQFLNFGTLENIETVINQALSNQQIVDDDGALKTCLKEIISKIPHQTDLFSQLTRSQTVYIELPFILDCGSFYLRGKMDRLFLKDGEWHGMDFKTDLLLDQEDLPRRIKAYEGQLGCYALAIHRILNVSEITTSLFFTSGSHLVNLPWSQATLEKFESELLIKIKKTTSFDYPPDTKICLHCPYYELDYCGIKSRA